MRIVSLVAVSFISILSFLGCTTSPDLAYEKASKSDSLAAYSKFIEEYPKSPLAQKAHDQIKELTNTLFVAGIRQICNAQASEGSQPPWDKILQNNNTDIMALAMKGIAEAQKGDLEGAKATFKECSQKAYETLLAPYLLEVAAMRNNQIISLQCPLPASIANNALLLKGSSQSIESNQFFYEDLNASSNSRAIFGGQAIVYLWEVPSGSTAEIIRKIMDENMRTLSGK